MCVCKFPQKIEILIVKSSLYIYISINTNNMTSRISSTQNIKNMFDSTNYLVGFDTSILIGETVKQARQRLAELPNGDKITVFVCDKYYFETQTNYINSGKNVKVLIDDPYCEDSDSQIVINASKN